MATLLGRALQYVAAVVVIIGVSACALQQDGMAGRADGPYRLGLQALVADPPDYEQAVEHFRAAAIGGHAMAQRQLGRLYASLSPQPDLVRAYLWLFLASRSDPDAQRELDVLSQVMTREQIGAARALALELVPGKAPDLAPEPVHITAPNARAPGSAPALDGLGGEEQPAAAREDG